MPHAATMHTPIRQRQCRDQTAKNRLPKVVVSPEYSRAFRQLSRAVGGSEKAFNTEFTETTEATTRVFNPNDDSGPEIAVRQLTSVTTAVSVLRSVQELCRRRRPGDSSLRPVERRVVFRLHYVRGM